jgi:hypothetical protein
LGGFFLGYSTLLRVFPMFIFSGPLLVMLRQMLGEPSPGRPAWKPAPFSSLRELVGRIDKRYLRLFGGAALAAVLLVPISLATSSGVEGYRHFVQNTQKHKLTPLTNYMGLKTVAIYRPSEVGRVLKNDRLEDPWGNWKKVKLHTFTERWPLFVALVLGYVALLWVALRHAEPWVACSMGAMMMAVGVELTCYYYSFLFVVAFLYEKRREAGAILVAATAMTGFLDWAPTRYLPNTPPWDHLRMPQWLDEQYTWMSVAILVAFAWILYRFGYLDATAAPAVEEAAVVGPPPAEEARAAGRAGRRKAPTGKRKK